MVVHIAIAFDHNYLKPFCSLLESALRNHQPASLKFHIIATGLTPEFHSRIEQYVSSHGASMIFYTVDQNEVSKYIVTSTWTSSVYYRLYFPLLVDKTIGRLLYLDTDTIVLNDLTGLYAQDMHTFPVAAVYDNYVVKQPLIDIHTEGNYFNSGVLLIDLSRWNQQAISSRAMDYLIKYPEKIRFVDQCALNAVLKDNWWKLETRYNLIYSAIPQQMSNRKKKEFIRDKVVLHFTLERPWNMLCKNPYRNLYKLYLRKSPLTSHDYLNDFSVLKIPAWLYLQIVEFYNGRPALKTIWTTLKRLTAHLK